LDAEHFGEKFMRKGKIVSIDPIMGRQDPAAAAGFDRVDGIAGDSLEGLS
jgi:hypothetical protein